MISSGIRVTTPHEEWRYPCGTSSSEPEQFLGRCGHMLGLLAVISPTRGVSVLVFE